ncbi:Spy/CpxP family protein refolding chaperone [Candidatus Magnetomonas plexicatena]|uniref:Spy/CpxP family protein refolding chaperone n=1 Tax=Candidatus Magnetomonas plexicatena TaxID=2552947 RepID=UPI0011031C9A|nr:hypothetical protein E2O03_001560 [Nitrospirales bacterium LBB_01]
MEKSRVYVTMTMFLLAAFIFGCFVLVQAESKMDSKEMLEMHQKIKALKKKKMAETLSLDKESSEKLMSIVDKYDDKKHELMHNMRNDIKNLKKAVDAKKVDTTKTLVDKILQNQKELSLLRVTEIDELRSMLTPEQQARYILFSVDFHRTIKKIMTEKRSTDDKDD